ncbi:MAG: Tol-Pal system beta propeller repeat protein TolB [Burkholderiales bacterium]
MVLASTVCGVPAHAALTIEITGGAASQIPIAVVPFAAEYAQAHRVSQVVGADLERSGVFKPVDPRSVFPQPHEPEDVRFEEWGARGADALVIGSIVTAPNKQIEVQFRLFDVVKQQQLAGFSYTVTPAQLRLTAHRIADVIYEKLTGIPGVFSTRIAYVLKNGENFRLEVADADGYGAQTVLATRKPIISPAWSPDGSQLAYVSFEGKRPTIYIQNMATGQRRMLLRDGASSSAPAWSPDGQRLCIVLTRDGNSQLYLVRSDGSGLQRLTRSASIDTEPSWSPDGKWLLFTSSRGGAPQIYRMPSGGGAAERMTFEGSYNVSPRYSPDGKSFAFIRMNGGQFQLATRDMVSGDVQGMTDGSIDESPSFAPNGAMIIYATKVNRRAVLATVSSDGSVRQRLTTSVGDVRDPAWCPFLLKIQ